MRIVMRAGAVVCGILLIVYLVSLSGVTWDEIVSRASLLRWYHIALFYLCYVAVYLVSALRWKLIAADIDPSLKSVPLFYFFRYIAFGVVSGFFVPLSLGDFGLRSAALRYGKKVSLAKGSFSIILDQFFTVAVGVIVLIPAVLFFEKKISLGQAVTCALFTVSAFFILAEIWGQGMEKLVVSLFRMLLFMVSRIPFTKKLLAGIGAMDKAVFLRKKTYGRVFLLSFCKYALMAAAIFILSQALGLGIAYFFYFMAFSVILFIIALPIIPGSLGIFELGWYGLLAGWYHAEAYQVVSLVLLYRLLLIVTTVSIAVVTFLFERH